MAVREIVPHTDAFLRKVSKPVKDFDESLWQLLDDMHETLSEVTGSGLSAVQVGVLKRAFIININGINMEFVNPTIIKQTGTQYKKEGCLSVTDLPFAYVRRPYEVTITAFDRYGYKFTYTCEDWTAVCVSHEHDHLDGILYIDKKCIPPKGREDK